MIIDMQDDHRHYLDQLWSRSAAHPAASCRRDRAREGPVAQNWDHRSWLAHRNSIPFFRLNFRAANQAWTIAPTQTSSGKIR